MLILVRNDSGVTLDYWEIQLIPDHFQCKNTFLVHLFEHIPWAKLAALALPPATLRLRCAMSWAAHTGSAKFSNTTLILRM